MTPRCRHPGIRGLILALIALSACAPATASAAGSGAQRLWGKTFVSFAVKQDGEPRELVRGSRITVGFARERENQVLRWDAGCNLFGAQLRVTRRLWTRSVAGTDMGCSPPARHRQDRWVTRFFGSNPRWGLRAGVLTLRSGGVLMRLRRTG